MWWKHLFKNKHKHVAACLLGVSVLYIFSQFLSNYNTKLITPENTVIFDALNLPLGTCPEEARWLQEGEKKDTVTQTKHPDGIVFNKKNWNGLSRGFFFLLACQ